MDALLAATRLPALAERTIRLAILSSIARRSLTPRGLTDAALLHFERAISRAVSDGVRPALLFAERDRIVRDLRRFLESKLAIRLAALAPRNIIARGKAARPFDAILRGKDGAAYALVLRRLPEGASRFKTLSSIHVAMREHNAPLAGALVYDVATARTLALHPKMPHIRPAA